MGLYYDESVGKYITTHSMIKSMRECPRQAGFKYADRLKPKRLSKPLRRGTWMHYLLEEHHAGRDWEAMHRSLTAKYNELFDEEKDFYGDLPTECLSLMKSYIWHYKDDPWKVLETEFTVEAEFPDGTLYRGKVDALIENQHGLWLVDHKTHGNLPGLTYRLLDAQSALYLWAALKNKLPVQGFMWNYLRTKPPAKPYLLKDGSRLSKKLGDTDWLTFTDEIKRLKAERGYRITGADVQFADRLKQQRYRPGEPQLSPFFQRSILEKDTAMLRRVATAAYHTSKRMNEYPWENKDAIERNVQLFKCERMCSYRDLCTAELTGGNLVPLLRTNYKVGDALDYYQDRAGEQRGDTE
jgi:hypothetical protein